MTTAEIIPFTEPPPPEPIVRICSFCKKHEDQVRKLFSNGMEGPRLKCICNECVATASERIRSVVEAKRAASQEQPA